jgi:hypothetical protein
MIAMMIAMMVAGIGSVLAGLLVILYGIPIREFGFGNTLILIGVLGVCTGMMLLALSAVLAELKAIARRLLMDTRVPPGAGARPILSPAPPQPAEDLAGAAPSVAPLSMQDDIPPRGAPPPDVEQATPAPLAPPPRPKRNLLFSSSVRKDRELAAGPGGSEPPANFDDAWPKIDRGRGGDVPPQRRGPRAPPPGPAEASTGAAPERSAPPPTEGQPGVTVLKSGVVDGMAYSLYSDGSIEAQMPEGLMRFASLDELTAHIDRRP